MKGLLTYILSLFLYLVLTAMVVVYLFVRSSIRGIKARSFRVFNNELSEYFHNNALGVDRAGNASVEPAANDWFVKPDGHRFGNSRETLSYVFGRNMLTSKLYRVGWFAAFFINAFFAIAGDFDHCQKAAINE